MQNEIPLKTISECCDGKTVDLKKLFLKLDSKRFAENQKYIAKKN